MSWTLTGSRALSSAAAATHFRTVKLAPSYGLMQGHVCSFVHCYPSSFRKTRILEGFSRSGRKGLSSSADMRPLLRIYGTANDSSNAVPRSVENDLQPKDQTSAKGGIRQWLQKFITGRSAQKEDECIWVKPFGNSPAEALANNLKRYGVAGMLSYGLLNTFYYLVTFLFVWFYVAPSEGGLGFVPASQRFVKIFAMVWAGSQVTKLFRAAGALTLAPFVDRGLNWYTERFNFKSRGKAFGFIVAACILLAISVFLIITTLWA